MSSVEKTSTVRVAVTQHEPVWLDLEGTVNKTCSIVEEAARAGAKLVAFPETWIPGYPAWFCISLGFSERDGDSVYISQCLINENGEIRMKRRKMKPTHMERTIFGDGSGDSLANVIDLPDIHVAGWPPLDPYLEGSSGFWSMSAEGALNQSQTYAIESQSFVLHATAVLTEAGIEVMRTKGSPIMGQPLGGRSAVIGPDGRVLSIAKTPGEELIIADLNLTDTTKAKLFADASGHCSYLLSISRSSNKEANFCNVDSRPDLLWLGADTARKAVVRVQKIAEEQIEASG
ncbi:carbon-nitrogen hydrolase [Trichoderma arundinaceum]|uniref:nitrilase n=1 Tax=Trichoderma arundinaceum TaxID=490622 RepID=A0A395NEG1_TRIAR|nr:carbon-nitrogen hydrolase [Trichoderma arundinaceum]